MPKYFIGYHLKNHEDLESYHKINQLITQLGTIEKQSFDRCLLITELSMEQLKEVLSPEFPDDDDTVFIIQFKGHQIDTWSKISEKRIVQFLKSDHLSDSSE